MVSHGRLDCARCWPGHADMIQECGQFRLVRDPGHWGASDPHTLVLGISKGNTQSMAFATEVFEAVAFVHVAHPSKGNGHFGKFIRGEGVSGTKRDWAREALAN